MNLLCERGTTQEYVDKTSGQRFFSVTQIRQMAYDSYAQVPLQYLEAARHRGNLVHSFLWKYLAAREGLLEFPAIPLAIEGYAASIINWARKNDVYPVLLEHTSCNRKHGYAGTIDALVRYGKKSILTLMDGKSGLPTVTDKVQLVLYEKMEGIESKQSVDVYFHEDGREAKEVWITAQDRITEWAWAMSALGNLKGRLSHGC